MLRNTIVPCLAALLIALPHAQAQDETQGQGQQKAQEQAQGQQQSGNVQFVGSLKPGQWLSTSIVGQEVRNPAGDAVGDVNALIVGEKNQVAAAVLGVGGFLGIGEKRVAVNFDAINRQRNQDGSTSLTTNVTKEQLNAAPEFEGREAGTMEQVKQQATEAGEQVQEAAGQAAEEAQQMGSTAAEKAEEAAQAAEEAARMAREEAEKAAGQSNQQQQ